MCGKRKFISIIVLNTILALVVSAEALRTYYIGNSLTWDAKPETQAYILEENGYSVDFGYHIACGKGLTYIEDNPAYTCVEALEPYGNWDNALANFEWDIVTIQAYSGGTGISEVLATANIIATAVSDERNLDCIFYLYLAWPSRDDTLTFADRMIVPFGGNGSPVFLSTGFLDYWYSKITALFPSLDIRVLPTGEAFAIIDEKLREIEITPYTDTYDLYRDIHHMNLEEGRHVAMSTMISAISGIRTKEIVYPSDYLSSIDAIFLDLSDEVVWYALTSDERVKMPAKPEIEISKHSSGQLECSFIGSLYESEDLNTWRTVIDASSPYRLMSEEQSSVFYRSSN